MARGPEVIANSVVNGRLDGALKPARTIIAGQQVDWVEIMRKRKDPFLGNKIPPQAIMVNPPLKDRRPQSGKAL